MLRLSFKVFTETDHQGPPSTHENVYLFSQSQIKSVCDDICM